MFYTLINNKGRQIKYDITALEIIDLQRTFCDVNDLVKKYNLPVEQITPILVEDGILDTTLHLTPESHRNNKIRCIRNDEGEPIFTLYEKVWIESIIEEHLNKDKEENIIDNTREPSSEME